MEVITTKSHNREGWPAGPWDNEGDRVDFEAHGFACMLLRGPVGAWCGYVGVGPDHPWYKKSYSDYDDVQVEVHGGLTYSNLCTGSICHVPKEGYPADVWWFGFDCAHCDDIAPDLLKYTKAFPGDVYRDEEYVKGQVTNLAKQLREVQDNA